MLRETNIHNNLLFSDLRFLNVLSVDVCCVLVVFCFFFFWFDLLLILIFLNNLVIYLVFGDQQTYQKSQYPRQLLVTSSILARPASKVLVTNVYIEDEHLR